MLEKGQKGTILLLALKETSLPWIQGQIGTTPEPLSDEFSVTIPR